VRRMFIALAVSFVVIAGCGGAENEPNLAQAIDRTEAEGSGKFEVTGFQRANRKPVAFECAGSADYAGKRVHVDCDYADEGGIEGIAIGNDVYIRGSLFAGGDVGADTWVRMEGDDEEDSLQNLSPQRLLSMLRTASSETEHIGEQEVRGEATVRYRLTVECESAQLSCAGSAPVDVWIGDDGVVRRIALEDDDWTATFEFFDFGTDVDIDAPPADQVVDEDSALSSGGWSSYPVECASAAGEAKPISRELAVSALRRNGFSMGGDSGSCLVSNTSGDATDVLAQEGIVHCGIHAEPPADAPRTVTRSGADGADAELTLENLVCTIVTDSPTGESKIDRLEQAFAELEREIRP
jgi:hypothetical protein